MLLEKDIQEVLFTQEELEKRIHFLENREHLRDKEK